MPCRPLHKPLIAPRRRPPCEGGFALLITITLLAFLVLLLVSLASLTRVETQVAANSRGLSQARQNALMALNLAIGRLQRDAGPDQRVTARADVAVPSEISITVSSSGAAAQADLDAYWIQRRNRRWTGVWRNGNTSAYDKENPAAFNPAPELLGWLVSGNENSAAGDGFKPGDQIEGLTLAGITDPQAAISRFGTAARPYRLLVGDGSAGIRASADVDRSVVVPEIEIKSSAAPGAAGASATIGHYAWWVGDEGVKARANLIDRYASAGTAQAGLLRMQAAQRPAIEAMNSTLSPGYPANAAALDRVLRESQLALVAPPPALPSDQKSAYLAELKSRYHDLTFVSRGVLADARHGGLRCDLSYVLGQSDTTSLAKALRAIYGTGDVVPEPSPSDSKGNALATVTATPYAVLPSVLPSSDIFDNSATWEQLWSFHNMGALQTASPAGVFDASGTPHPRRHTAIRHGLSPLVVQTKLFFRLRIVGGAADASGVNRTGIIWVDTIPVVVLANPYSVPLAATDYEVILESSKAAQLAFDTGNDVSNLGSTFKTYAYTSGADPVWWGSAPFVLRSAGMAPGEAQIFTISPSANPTASSDARIDVTSQPASFRVVMTNDYDPFPAVTYNTGKSIPAGMNYAILRIDSGNASAKLHLAYDSANPGVSLLHEPYAMRHYSAGVSNYDTGTVAVVYPLSDGLRQGGGITTVVNQAASTDYPAPTSSNANTLFVLQQAPFYQVNYRAQYAYPVGNFTPAHPLEWSKRFVKSGATGTFGDTPNPWLLSNLMMSDDGRPIVRWGLVNIGAGQEHTQDPSSISGNTGFKNILYDIPHPGVPLVSLGALQHFNTTGFGRKATHSWQVNYAVGNSYPHPRVPREYILHYYDGNWATGQHYDGSYLWNDLFWDRFHFSGYPQQGTFDFATEHLPCARLRPFRERTIVAWDDESAFRGDGDPAKPANARATAKNLLVDGSFNINSTSVEAWKALFSSLRNIPVGTQASPASPFARTLSPTAGSVDAKTGSSENAWAGFRDLDASELQSLAEEMVLQVRRRAPFLSMSEFVNRRLISKNSDTFGLGLSGPLQAALDKAVNQAANIDSRFRIKASTRTNWGDKTHNTLMDQDYVMPTSLVGFPGHVLQGDVLSALGPALSARSDTFTIRAYGDNVNPATGNIDGRAWCEAVVQRTPDYVDSTPAVETPAPGSVADTFGRRFLVVSFRWLTSDDI